MVLNWITFGAVVKIITRAGMMPEQAIVGSTCKQDSLIESIIVNDGFKCSILFTIFPRN